MDVLSSLLGGVSLTEIFGQTINNWMGDVVASAFKLFDDIMINILNGIFHAEDLVNAGATTVLTADSIRRVYLFIYAFTCSLVILKFLFKGFQIYILWRDGDADVSPRDMVVGSVEAGVVMVCFPYLYEKATNIFIYLGKGIMGRLGVSGETGILSLPLDSLLYGGFLFIIFLLIFAIMVFVLWIRLIGRGFELLILRLGLPFATLGLLDSDLGMFKGYMQIFFKAGFTSIIQVALMALALRIIGTFDIRNILAAIAVISTAFATPTIMQQLLVANRPGGGLSQKVYSAGMMARAVQSFMR